MTILITGGAGFIGSTFVKQLLLTDKECRVIILDALTYAGNLDNLKSLITGKNLIIPENHSLLTQVAFNRRGRQQNKLSFNSCRNRWKYKLKGYKPKEIANKNLSKTAEQILNNNTHNNRLLFVVGFIEDPRVVESLLCLSDYIINFAAETHVDRSILHPDTFIKTDIYGTFSLMQATRKTNTIKRFIHISTDEVYGHRKKGKNMEVDPLNPTNPYSASKASAEKLILSYKNTYNIPVNIIRPTNVFGPYQYPEKFIPIIIIKAINKQSLPVYGDGKQSRDWIYVEDLVRAIQLVLKNAKIGEIYNIAGRNEWKNIELVNYILNYLGKDKNLIKYIKNRPGHDRRYSINDKKIRKSLGFSTKHNFNDMLDHTINWYVNNEKWWQKIIKHDPEYKSLNKALYNQLI